MIKCFLSFSLNAEKRRMLENTKQPELLPLTTASKLARETEAAARSNSLLARTLPCGASCAYTAVRNNLVEFTGKIRNKMRGGNKGGGW